MENGVVYPFPASGEPVCQGQVEAPSTVQRRLDAIRKVHRLLGMPDPAYEKDINLAMRKVRRQKTVRPRLAKVLTRTYLDRLLGSEPDTPWGLRDKTMLALGYELMTRRSELIALRNEDVSQRSDGTRKVLIGRSKADPFWVGPDCVHVKAGR